MIVVLIYGEIPEVSLMNTNVKILIKENDFKLAKMYKYLKKK